MVLKYESKEGNVMDLQSLEKVKGTRFQIMKKNCFPHNYFGSMELADYNEHDYNTMKETAGKNGKRLEFTNLIGLEHKILICQDYQPEGKGISTTRRPPRLLP